MRDVIVRDLMNTEIAIALVAKLAEKAGITSFTVKLTTVEVLDLVHKYDVQVTREQGEMKAESFAFAATDTVTIEFKERRSVSGT